MVGGTVIKYSIHQFRLICCIRDVFITALPYYSFITVTLLLFRLRLFLAIALVDAREVMKDLTSLVLLLAIISSIWTCEIPACEDSASARFAPDAFQGLKAGPWGFLLQVESPWVMAKALPLSCMQYLQGSPAYFEVPPHAFQSTTCYHGLLQLNGHYRIPLDILLACYLIVIVVILFI